MPKIDASECLILINSQKSYCRNHWQFLPKAQPKKVCIFTLRFRLDFVDPIEQNRRTSSANSRILRLRIGKRWLEDEMSKFEVSFGRVLNWLLWNPEIFWGELLSRERLNGDYHEDKEDIYY